MEIGKLELVKHFILIGKKWVLSAGEWKEEMVLGIFLYERSHVILWVKYRPKFGESGFVKSQCFLCMKSSKDLHLATYHHWEKLFMCLLRVVTDLIAQNQSICKNLLEDRWEGMRNFFRLNSEVMSNSIHLAKWEVKIQVIHLLLMGRKWFGK